MNETVIWNRTNQVMFKSIATIVSVVSCVCGFGLIGYAVDIPNEPLKSTFILCGCLVLIIGQIILLFIIYMLKTEERISE